MIGIKRQGGVSRFAIQGALSSSLLWCGCGGLVSSKSDRPAPPTQLPSRSAVAPEAAVSFVPSASTQAPDSEVDGTSPTVQERVGLRPASEGLDAGSEALAPDLPLVPFCLEGEVRCMDANVEVCDAGGEGWSIKETCVTAAVCEPFYGGCILGGPEPGTLICNGASLQRANDSRTGFDEIELCAADCLCDAVRGDCRPPTCATGEVRCNGSTLEVCNLCTGGFDFVEECDSPSICEPSLRRCTDGVLPAFDAGGGGASVDGGL